MTCTADTEHGCVQDVQSLVLNIKCLERLERAQEMREDGRVEGAERDSGDREKNRLTSLHLIGSSCNRRKKKTKRHRGQGKKQTTDDRKQSETREKKTHTHETARHREGKRTAPQRLAVRDD